MPNQYVPFANGPSANALTNSAWVALTTLLANGFQPGVASSEQINTLLRQVSTAAAGTAEFASLQGSNMVDDGSMASFAAGLLAAVNAVAVLASRQTTKSEFVPPGMYAPFARSTPPTGWLEANGAIVLRAAYPDLFAAIGGTYGLPSPTTFTLPDARGLFLRGWDNGRGIDPSRTFGTQQLDALQNITGSLGAGSADTVNLAAGTGAFVKNGPASNEWGADAKGTTEIGYTFDASRVVRTANETRPNNLSVLICIKY